MHATASDKHLHPSQKSSPNPREQPTIADSERLDATIPETAAISSTPHTHRRSSSSQSAPPAHVKMMVQQSQSHSQRAAADATKAMSFHGYPGGDTQEMPSQVYRTYAESMAAPATTTPKKVTLHVTVPPDGKVNMCNTTTTDLTPHTCAEGDMGFIDLEKAWQLPSPTARSASDIDELLASPETQFPMAAPARPAMPETPALAGHKRRRSGELLTSAATKASPGFSQVFGNAAKGPVLSATQMFDQTQAPSSPMPDGPRSDPVLTRPSPNLLQQRSYSSPAVTTSSPIATIRSRPPTATSGEPRDNYTSMLESQERRMARLAEQRSQSGMTDEWEEEERSGERTRYENGNTRRAVSHQSLGDLASLTAHPRAGLRASFGRKVPETIDLVTPATTRQDRRVEFDGLDDTDDEELPIRDDIDAGMDREATDGEQVMAEDELVAADEDADDDVYDELAQVVLRSQSNAPDEVMVDEQDAEESEADDDDIDLEHAKRRSILPQLIEQTAGDGLITQITAIADSQSAGLGPTLPQGLRQETTSLLMSSFVPGSQYAGKTSQDQAQRKPLASPSPVRDPPHEEAEMKLPSSPPLQTMDSMVPNNTMEASLARREVLARFQQESPSLPVSEGVIVRTQHEIPESDLPSCEVVAPSSRPNTAPADGTTAPFSTARTHLSMTGLSPAKGRSANSPLKLFASQHSRLSIESPRRAAGVRRFADIAAEPQLLQGSGETDLDVDAIMGDLMTTEDREFIDAVSSPPPQRPANKRRKLARGLAKDLFPDEGTRVSVAESASKKDDGLESGAGDMNAVHDGADDDRLAHVLQRNASKGNEMPTPTPEEVQQPKSTQESVKRREAAGADTVSKLLSARTDEAERGRRGAAPTEIDVKRLKTYARKPRAKAKAKPAASEKLGSALEVGAVTADAEEDRAARPYAVALETVPDPPGTPALVAPNRVLALFKGNFLMFYPATYLGPGTTNTTYRVRFDDTTTTEVEHHLVRSLDLRIGDAVKIDRAGMKKQTWLVQDFGEVGATSELLASGCDVYGHTTITLSARSSRSSLPTVGVDNEASETVVVAIANLYLTKSMWAQFAGRFFIPPASVKATNVRAQTPSGGIRTPDIQTPGSRSRRTALTGLKSESMRASHLRDESVASSMSRQATGMFTGMAFAISYASNEAEKAEVTRQIVRNGGMILESGFEELFDMPAWEEYTAASPLKGEPALHDPINPITKMQLKSEYEGLGFVALIADKHSRRAKYMQALALGLPTLSGRWITDSLLPTKNPHLDHSTDGPTTLPSSRYLLPSGESAYLGGAIRSRTIATYSAADAKLADVFEAREKLLDGDGVLIVAPKKAKNVWERRKAYAFLTLAIGAGHVQRVADMAEVKAALAGDPGKWSWVYVDGDMKSASAELSGGKAGLGRKRKRSELMTDKKLIAEDDSAEHGKVKVVNDEFVVQSLILGALTE